MLIRYPPQGNSHRNVFASFDEIPLITLSDIKETVYTKAIKNNYNNIGP